MELSSSQIEISLKKINVVFNEFTSFYGSLIEKGIEETEYNETFKELSQTFKELYVKAKTNYDALQLNKRQFEEGRLERDGYERSLTRIEQYIIGAEFEIRLKILPQLKKTEKELLQKHIVAKVEEISLPPKTKEETRKNAEKINELIAATEKEDPIDQIKEYVKIGNKIVELGQKIWAATKKVTPVALPLILRIFAPH